MATKAGLISTVLLELRKAQTEKWSPPPAGPVKRITFPPALWLGNGESLAATEALVNAVASYTQIHWENDPTLKPRFKFAELVKLAEQSFAQVLATIDLVEDDDALHPIVSERVEQLLADHIQRHHRPIDLTLGCHLLESEAIYPFRVGPVLFETREGWRERMLAADKLTFITARRLSAAWEGKALRARKPSFDSSAEQSILDTVGYCPIICTVETDGLSGKYAQEKGLLAARIAMTAISLLWLNPAESLKWMNLLYDRRRSQRHTVMFGSKKRVGANSERSDMPSGKYVNAELIENLTAYQWLFEQVGEALFAYVQPIRPIVRPKMMNALLLSLWWFHAACREPQDQMATTMFAASMDALAAGGKAKGIVRLIEARLGPKADDPLMKDGGSTSSVIGQIYDAGRSRLIHGSSADFAHDWTSTRGNAEAVGRWLLVACCDWLSQNPAIDKVKDLSS